MIQRQIANTQCVPGFFNQNQKVHGLFHFYIAGIHKTDQTWGKIPNGIPTSFLWEGIHSNKTKRTKLTTCYIITFIQFSYFTTTLDCLLLTNPRFCSVAPWRARFSIMLCPRKSWLALASRYSCPTPSGLIGKKRRNKGKKRNFVANFFSSQCVRGKKLWQVPNCRLWNINFKIKIYL